ncbi:septin-interacting protein 1 [Onthophagus taurus]|uniref:septin-interacting protein 1 n=1 Tax=Onthophagus taurus TaxID=166361 RepID=UPI0039BDC034
MSEEEIEKFEITDFDIENEFNINRSRRKQTKQQQIYGIWADDSDEEEDARPSFKSKAQKSYSAPIGFVAGGVQQSGKKKDEMIKKEGDGSDDDEAGTSYGVKNSSSESEEEGFSKRGFGSSKKQPTQATVTEITADIAGLRSKKGFVNNKMKNEGVGNWEKHTKGIGAKLLLQMGFKPGKGLGKDLQGISTPVEAHLRKGRGAIGAYGPEKKTTLIKKANLQIEDQEEEQETKWKKNDGGKKTRYYYKSVDDVIEKGKRPGANRNLGPASELSKVKVIDMTGPQQRVLSGYHALSGLKAPPGVERFEDVVHKKCTNFTLPEIQHNLDLLVDMCEQDIIRIDRNTRNNQDKLQFLKQDEINVKNTLIKEEETAETLSEVLEIVNKLMDTSLGLSLGQVAGIFKQLQERHIDEYCQYGLGELAPGLVGPLLTSALASWQPLSSPRQYTDLFRQWKEILEKPLQRGTLEGNCMGIQPFDSLLWHTWVPVVRSCISVWRARDCDPLIYLLEAWKPLLPVWLMDNVLDQYVMPKLIAEVQSWDPLTDTVPIHTWVHPWIPLLDVKLQDKIYPIIQEKLGVCLANWHPSDRSAKPMLKPWQRVLPEGSFVAFLLKHIVPKLQLCMQQFIIYPHQQPLEPWHWVMDWSDMLSVGNMTLILDKFFFPRWLQTLAMWLNQNPDYAQVTDWYSGWKRMMSDQLLKQPTIKDNFHKALEIMNRAASSGHQPGAKESVSYLANIETNIPLAPPPPKISSFAETVRTASQIPQGFKDLVAKRCEEKGILFVPIPNKYHEAKQVYRLGSNGVQCYIDRNVVFYTQNNSTWLPTSLNRLLDMA